MDSRQRPDERTCFLNVDLDIEAPYDLAPLVEALAPHVFELHTGPGAGGYQTHLELAREPDSADRAIRGYVGLLSGLAPPARRLWDSATRRDFNIGIQSGATPHAFELALEPGTLREVSLLGARVVVTVYADDF
jgi:hypothetical protein